MAQRGALTRYVRGVAIPRDAGLVITDLDYNHNREMVLEACLKGFD